MKKLRGTRVLTCLLVLVMVFATTACAGTNKPGSDSKPGSKDLDFVTLDWYIGLDPMPDHDMVNDAINDYLKEKVNANVNLFYWPAADWETKMTTMLSAGQDVGIVGFGSQSKLDYVVQSNRGSFYPMDELLKEYAAGTLELFAEEIWESMKVDGKIYGIPSLKDNCYIMSLIYNADMADALGLDMSKVQFTDWRQIEPFLTEVLEKRQEKFPEYNDYPLCANVAAELPYHFQLETFLDHFYAVANIEPFNNIAGYDTDTIFNLYETDEYREYARGRQRMVEKGIFAYDYTGKTEWNYTGGLFGFAGWGYTYMQENLYGDNFKTKMIVSDRIWTETKNYFSAGTAISAKCAEPERAMMILNMVNTDPDFATMMRFGIKDEHYIFDKDNKMQFEGSKRNSGERADWGYYYWYAAPIGNLLIVNAPEGLTGPDGIMLTEMERYNNEAVIPTYMGFVLDVNPISNEIAATTNVVMEYRDIIRNGQLESQAEVDATVDEFVAKLKANNVDKIVEEVQKQVDEWKKNK